MKKSKRKLNVGKLCRDMINQALGAQGDTINILLRQEARDREENHARYVRRCQLEERRYQGRLSAISKLEEMLPQAIKLGQLHLDKKSDGPGQFISDLHDACASEEDRDLVDRLVARVDKGRQARA